MKDRFDFIKVIIIHLEASLLLKEVSLPELNISKLSSHGCTKLPNLEMEPKCLMKSDVQLIPDISRTKNDKRIL